MARTKKDDFGQLPANDAQCLHDNVLEQKNGSLSETMEVNVSV